MLEEHNPKDVRDENFSKKDAAVPQCPTTAEFKVNRNGKNLSIQCNHSIKR